MLVILVILGLLLSSSDFFDCTRESHPMFSFEGVAMATKQVFSRLARPGFTCTLWSKRFNDLMYVLFPLASLVILMLSPSFRKSCDWLNDGVLPLSRHLVSSPQRHHAQCLRSIVHCVEHRCHKCQQHQPIVALAVDSSSSFSPEGKQLVSLGSVGCLRKSVENMRGIDVSRF